jgi:hypothetical protein
MKRAPRNGFSLMEVLLATSILLASLIVLGQLANVGRQHAHDADKLTTAELLCQTKLNEVLAGIERVRPVDNEALPEAPGWVWSLHVGSAEKLHLASLRVTVSEELLEPEGDAVDQRPPKQFTLTRWIRDPDHQDAASSRADSLVTPPAGLDEGGGELP